MTAALGPATAALQAVDVARPAARPGEPNPRGDDAFAAQLARARNDAPSQPGRPARAEPGSDGETDATAATAAARDASDEAPQATAEWLAGLAHAPAAASATATTSTPIAIDAIDAAAAAAAATLAAAASAKSKAGARPLTDDAAHRAGPQVADAVGPFAAPSAPPGAGVLPEPARELATKGLDDARADAGLHDATQAALQARSASSDAVIAASATVLPAPSPVAAPATTPAAAAHAAPPSLHIAAAVDTPAFAPALAQQVSWMVREGLGMASLHLNPPELGPVSVQIVVDGRQARVDFGAEMALTRSAIEDSLPRLASAMQEAGLTLSGGGVFDGRPPRDAPEPPVERGPAVEEGARPTPASGAGPGVRTSTRGLVDLVA